MKAAAFVQYIERKGRNEGGKNGQTLIVKDRGIVFVAVNHHPHSSEITINPVPLGRAQDTQVKQWQQYWLYVEIVSLHTNNYYTAVFVTKTSFPWKYEEKCLCMCYPCVSPVTWFWYWGVTYRVVTFFDNILLSTGQNNAACNGDRSAMDEQHKNNRRQTLLSIRIGVLASCWSSQMIQVPECLVAPPRQWAHRGKKNHLALCLRLWLLPRRSHLCLKVTLQASHWVLDLYLRKDQGRTFDCSPEGWVWTLT